MGYSPKEPPFPEIKATQIPTARLRITPLLTVTKGPCVVGWIEDLSVMASKAVVALTLALCAVHAQGRAVCASGSFLSCVSCLDKDACLTCPAGKYSTRQLARWISGDQGCLPCSRGHYQALLGQSSCASCPGGKYQHKHGQLECEACAAGTGAGGGAWRGATYCSTCGAGRFSMNAGVCTACPGE